MQRLSSSAVVGGMSRWGVRSVGEGRRVAATAAAAQAHQPTSSMMTLITRPSPYAARLTDAERAKRERDNAKLAAEREKEKARKLKEREKAKAEKEKAAIARQRAREREQREQEQAKAQRERAREKARRDKIREKEQAIRAKNAEERAFKASKPKRAPSPYALFLKDHYARVAAANPAFSAPQVTKALSVEWKTFPESEKARLAARSAADRQRWLKETEAWTATQPPKRPKSAYLLFCDEYRQAATRQLSPNDKSVTAAAKVLGQMWRAAADAEKRKYQDQADLLLAEWQKKMESLD